MVFYIVFWMCTDYDRNVSLVYSIVYIFRSIPVQKFGGVVNA